MREIYDVDWQTRSGALSSLDGAPWSTGAGQALKVPAGSVVFFHDHMPHYSSENHSHLSRQAFTMHFSESDAHWKKNWLQRPDLGVFKF